MNRIPVLLLTGFLGSGKTTILNRLIADARFCDTAVIINEAGAVGIDHLLVESSRDDIVLLDGGCMCCVQRGSLGAAMAGLIRRREDETAAPFQRVAIETSGLADPGPILQAMIQDAFFSRTCAPAGVVTVVDAATAGAALEDHAEAAAQIQMADKLLVTKTDLATTDDRRELEERLAALNPQAPRLEVAFGAVDAADVWLDLLGLSPAWLSQPPARFASARVSSIATASLAFEGAHSAEEVDAWLEHTVELLGPHLLRLKGVLDIVGQPLPVVIHGVRHLVHSPGTLREWPPGGRSNRLVLIGRDVDQAVLDDALARLAETAWRPILSSDATRTALGAS